jgi:hypothetical protein
MSRLSSAGILKQTMGARNRVGIGLSYRPMKFCGPVLLLQYYSYSVPKPSINCFKIPALYSGSVTFWYGSWISIFDIFCFTDLDLAPAPESRSCSFRQWLPRCKQKISFFLFDLLITFCARHRNCLKMSCVLSFMYIISSWPEYSKKGVDIVKRILCSEIRIVCRQC